MWYQHLLFVVLLPTSIITGTVRDEPKIVWDKEVSPLEVYGLQMVPIPAIDQCCVPGVRNLQGSSKKESSLPNVVINISNFFCINGMQEVNVDPIKNHIVNVAGGNQEINSPQACGVTDTHPRTTKHIFEIPTAKKDAQHGILSKCGERRHDSRNPCRVMLNEYLNGRSELPQNNENYILLRRVFEIPQSLLISAKPHCEEYHQFKDYFSCKEGLDAGLLQVDPPNHRFHSWPENPKIAGSNFEWAPNLKLFVDGKRVIESKGHQTIQNDKHPANNFDGAMEAVLHDSSYPGIGKKFSICDPEEFPTCNHDFIIFLEGFELTYDQFEQVFEEIADRPEHIKLIVPGGVTGPLLGYFQQVELTLCEIALQHGVCLLSNGFLVPIRPMLRIIQLHGWLSSLDPNLMSESSQLLHVSMWTDMKSVLGMLQCLIKSDRVMVAFPSRQKVPFHQFELQVHHTPNIILEQMKVELFGFSISYAVFKNGLLELCKSVGTSLTS